MIPLQTILDRMRQIGLDAEGADYYRDDIDMIPAVNAAIEWVVSVLSGELGKDKFVEERLSDLHTNKIWQTSSYSRVALSTDVWTVTGIYPKPKVVISPNSLPQNAYTAQFVGLYNKVLSNAPISKVNTSGQTLANFESILRPELSLVEVTNEASKGTVEQYMATRQNPFSPGFDIDHPLAKYVYFPTTNFESSGYKTAGEYEIQPYLKRGLVSVGYIKVPTPVNDKQSVASQSVEFPLSMTEAICLKALNNIAFKQGDQTNLYKVSIQDLISVLR